MITATRAQTIIAGATAALAVTATAGTYYLRAPDTVNESPTYSSVSAPERPCLEDQPCWDCSTMGNLICGDGGLAPMDWAETETCGPGDMTWVWDSYTETWLPAVPVVC